MLSDSEEDELDLDNGYCESEIEIEYDDHLNGKMHVSDFDQARSTPVSAPSGVNVLWWWWWKLEQMTVNFAIVLKKCQLYIIS